MQALHTGKYLKNRIPEIEKKFGIKFDEILIETSPWVRTLQTASQIAAALEIDQVKVNYLMSENPYYLKGFDDPLDEAFEQLDLKTNPELTSQTLNGLTVIDQNDNLEYMKNVWSKGLENLPVRAKKIRNSYIEKH